MAKVLFINPVVREEDVPRHIPYGMAILANYARQDGHLVQVFDANAWRVGFDALEEVLLAVGDAEESVFDDADVSSVEPSVLQDFCGLLGVLVVSDHDVGALDQNLTVIRDFHVNAIPELAHAANLQHVGTVGRIHADHR